MEKQDFLDAIASIGMCEDEVERRTLLSDLRDSVCLDYDSFLEMKDRNTTLTEDNETLRKANMKLFLKVGETKTQTEQIKDSTGIDDKKVEPLKFEDLLTKEGGLK